MGDTHNISIIPIIKKYNMNNSILIHVGDFGIGFRYITEDTPKLKKLDLYLKNNKVKLMVIRGNHDDPEFWESNLVKDLENIEFVSDYSYKKINGKIFLFVGGAVSIDRQLRVENVDWWKNEKFVLANNLENLQKCDVLITHSSPSGAYPSDGFSTITAWFVKDENLKPDLIEERENIRKLYDQVCPTILCFGHFHRSNSEYVNGAWHRCLNIDEVVDLTTHLI